MVEVREKLMMMNIYLYGDLGNERKGGHVVDISCQ